MTKKTRTKNLVKLRLKGPQAAVEQIMDLLRPALEKTLQTIDKKDGTRIGRSVRTTSTEQDTIAEAHVQVPMEAILNIIK
jgi:hypothetical protein